MPSHKPHLKKFTQNMRSQSFNTLSRHLRCETVDTPDDQIAVFGPESEECLYLCRLLLADARPVWLSQTWLPMEG